MIRQSLGEIRTNLLSDKVRTRSTAAGELASFFEVTSNTESLNDKGYYQLLETLYTVVQKERTAYRGSKSIDAAAERLRISGDLVKVVLEKAIKKLKPRTINYVIDKLVADCFPSDGMNILEDPLLTPTAKISLTITSFPSHVEHLSYDEWFKLSSICSEVLQLIAVRSGNKGIKRPPAVTNDFLEALYNLLKNKTSSDITQFKVFFGNLSQFLVCFNCESAGHVFLFKCFNEIIVRLHLQDIAYCQKMSLEILKAVPGLLGCKHPELKVELFIFLMYSSKVLVHGGELVEESAQLIEKLYSALLSERANNSSMHFLPTKNLRFIQERPSTSWLTLPLMCVGCNGDEFPWLSMLVTYQLSLVCAKYSAQEGASNKRQRTSEMGDSKHTALKTEDSALFDFIIEHMEGSMANLTGCAQVLAIDFQHRRPKRVPAKIIRKLVDICSFTVDGAGWAFIALGCIIHYGFALDDSLGDLAQEVWGLCCHKVHIAEHSSAACFTLSLIVSSKTFSVAEKVSDITSMVDMFGSHGPVLSSGGFALWNRLLKLNISSSLTSLCLVRGLSWLLACWRSSLLSKRVNKTTLYGMTFGSLDLAKIMLLFGGVNFTSEKIPKFTGRIAEAAYTDSFYRDGWSYLSTLQVLEPNHMQTKAEPHVSADNLSIKNCQSILSECRNILDELNEMRMSKEKRSWLNLALQFVLSCIVITSGVAHTSVSLRVQGYELLAKAVSLLRDLCGDVNLDQVSEEVKLSAVYGTAVLSSLDDIFNGPSFEENFQNAVSSLNQLLGRIHKISDMDGWGSSSAVKVSRIIPHDEFEIDASELEQITRAVVISGCISNRSDPNSLKCYIKGLDGFEFISGLQWLSAPSRGKTELSGENLRELVREAGMKILQDYNWQTSEIALLSIIRLLKAKSTMWMANSAWEKLTGDCVDILKFTIRLTKKGTCHSEKVKASLCDILCTILSRGSSRCQQMRNWLDELAPFSRDNSYLVRFISAQCLEHLFKECDNTGEIYFRIHAELGPIYHSYEDSAFRGYMISSMAIGGHELPVPIYNLLEISQVSGGEKIVRALMKRIATYFNFGSSKKLFCHISGSILFYWVANKMDLEKFPYYPCGYASFTDFLAENIEEISATVLVEHSQKGIDYIEYLGRLLDVPLDSILEQCFHKAIGYAYSASDEITTMKGIFSNRLGIGKYRSLLSSRFIDIISVLIQLCDFQVIPEEFLSVKLFQRIYYGTQVQPLPESVRRSVDCGKVPLFVRSLCAELSLDHESLWEPSNYVYICRKVLGDQLINVHEIENCRKLRRCILTMHLFEECYTDSYALELTIAGVITFLSSDRTLTEACQTLGILFENGISYFRQHVTEYIDYLFRVILSFFDATKNTLKAMHVANVGKQFIQRLKAFVLENRICVQEEDDRVLEKALAYVSEDHAEPFGCEDVLAVLRNERGNFNRSSQSAFLAILGNQFSKFDDLSTSLTVDIRGISDELIKFTDSVKIPEYSLWVAKLLAKSYLEDGRSLKDIPEADERYFDKQLKLKPQHLRPFLGVLTLTKEIFDRRNFWELGFVEIYLRDVRKTATQEYLSVYFDTFSPQVTETLKFVESTLPSLDTTASLKELESMDVEFVDWIYKIDIVLLSMVDSSFPAVAGIRVLVEHLNEFRENVFPFLLHEVLQNPKDGAIFNHELRRYFNRLLVSTADPSIHKCLVQAILYLNFNRILEETPERTGLGVDLLLAARVADDVKMYKSALLLQELFWSGKRRPRDSDLPSFIYSNIDDPDIVHSAKITASLEGAAQNAIRQHRYWQAISFEAAVLDENLRSGEYLSNDSHLASSFLSLGLNGVSKIISESMDSNHCTSAEGAAYAWKLHQWDLPLASSSDAVNKNETIFKLFKRVSEQQSSAGVDKRIFNEALLKVLEGMKSKDNKKLFEMEETLAMINEIQEVLEIYQPQSAAELLKKQADRCIKWMSKKRFHTYEDIIRARITAWSVSRDRQKDNGFLEKSLVRGEASSLLNFCRMARENGDYNKAMDGVVRLEKLATSYKTDQDLTLELKFTSQMESSSASWEIGDESVSIELLKSLVEDDIYINLRKPNQGRLFSLSEVYSILALRSSQAKQEGGEDILQKYLDPAEEISVKEDSVQRAKVCHAYASFCEQQQNESSLDEEIERSSRLIARNRKEVNEWEQIKVSNDSSGQERTTAIQHLSRMKKVLANDEREYNSLILTKKRFYQLSTKYYLRCITESDEYSKDVSRFCALWLENSSDAELNRDVRELLKAVPSIRLAPWINQLSSRLSKDQKEEFQKALWTIVPRICSDHPYHTLYQIYSLKRLGDPNPKKKEDINPVLASRGEAGRALWILLQRKRYIDESFLKKFDLLCHKTINLAEYPVDRGVQKLSLEELRSDIKRVWLGLEDLNLPPPTLQITLRPDCQYDDLPKMTKIEKKISIAGGKSRPKIITMLADDGESYKMLVKGGDDLRQDAVMEQVFGQVNEVLKRDERTRTRNLSIRTYKVIPLGHRAGIIEFARNTVPLLNYLQPAHEKYHPTDWKLTKCRQEMQKVLDCTQNERIRVFEKIMKHVHPVMRHFFFDHFHSPDNWLQCRTNYSRSTAAISILGHILGLGDRHCNNILIDASNGEVIHIDFGFAFDQGKWLKIPETVPFRLTADVIDGMGISGVEGIFRRCCEFTLSVLRNEIETIMTILNVLKYDPLYSWSVSPLKKQKQKDESFLGVGRSTRSSVAVEPFSSEDPNEAEAAEADHALTVVRKKLSSSLSTEAVTRDLIQQATNRKNLALLFQGKFLLLNPMN